MTTAYRRINLELIVFEEDADAVVAKLSSAIDRLEDDHTVFGGEIETVTVEHSGSRRRSALRHTRDAGETAVDAIKKASGTVVKAIKEAI